MHQNQKLRDNYQPISHSNQSESQLTKQYFITGLAAYGFVYGFYRFFQLKFTQRRYKKQLNEISNYPSLQISEVIAQMKNQPSPSNLFFIEGFSAIPKESSSFFMDGKHNYLLYVTQKTSIYSTDSLIDQAQKLKYVNKLQQPSIEIETVLRQPRFELLDIEKKHKLAVNFKESTAFQNALIHLGSEVKKKDLSLAEWLGDFITVCLTSVIKVVGPASFTQYFLSDKKFRGIHLGYRENHFGIKVGGLVQVLGEVSYDTEAKTYSILNPRIITLSKSLELDQIKAQIQKCSDDSLLWLAFVALLGLYLSRRVYLYNKRNPGFFERCIDFFRPKKQPQLSDQLDQPAQTQ